MRKTDLPSLNRRFGNSLQLKRELVRSVGMVEMHMRRAQAMPDSRDELVDFLQKGIDYLNDLDDKAMGGLTVTNPVANLVVAATRQLVVNQKVGGSVTNVTADLTFVSSDPTKATVSAGGLVTGVAAGTTVIKATSDNGASVNYSVTVVAA